MQILIVEDSPTLRAAMKKIITNIGHQPIFAHSGEEALQTIGVKNFDLVIMDVEMPGLDGFETTRLMRETLRDQWIPIIFATSHTSDESVLAGIEAGGDDYLVKPISPALLEAKIKAMQRIAEMQGELLQLNAKLAALSETDGLTKLMNRRTFVKKAEQSLSESRRNSSPSTVLMLDVDFFKQYNDYYGHVEGDQCLKLVAKALKSQVRRDGDLVARYGGEEFVIYLPATDRAGAELIAQRIVAAVEALQIPHKMSSVSDYVTISVGTNVSIPDSGPSLSTLILGADKNLYHAKKGGRNRFIINEKRSYKTILIGESDPLKVQKLTNILQPLGNIITAECRNECIDLAKDLEPDLILLDDDCNRIQAQDVQDVLKSHLRTARTPVLLTTTNGDHSDNEFKLHIQSLESEQLKDRVLALLA